MAKLLASSSSLSGSRCFTTSRPRRCILKPSQRSPTHLRATTYKVEIEHEGQVKVLNVKDNETILDVALDNGLDLPHDCRLGVCMTCPAFLSSGQVDIGGSMLSEDVLEKGYTLLCQASPRSDLKVRTIEEGELVDLQINSQGL